MSENFATAPYNFVSLPEKILPSLIEDVETYKKQLQSEELFSGEISIFIESWTPLFIGGNGEKNFAPVKEIIPGSTLRGMMKNIFKIVTCSNFRGKTETQKTGEDFNDEHIYYRCLMKNNKAAWSNGYNWSKDLNKCYGDRMASTTFVKGKRKVQKKAIPGFLIKTTEGKYFIAPLDSDCYEGSESIRDRKFKNLKKSCVLWEEDKAYIFTGKGGKKKVVRFTEISDIDWDKKNWLELPDDVRQSYMDDRNRGGVNLLEEGILSRKEILKIARKIPAEVQSIVPCHFLKKGNEVTAFGHGQYFRIPYEHSIGEVVEKNLQTDAVDFTDAVFGKADFWASRVFFEDAQIISDAKTLPTAFVRPLMQPNPTSYQLYLQQNDKNSLSHWDSPNAKIRGYKMYWHNNNFENWQFDDVKNANVTKKISPLDAGSKFKSKIRFENLTKVELGALLMIFDLNGAKNPAYKIGMGKPLGLGSIKIYPKLFLETETAYTEIFDGDIFKNPYREEKFDEYLAEFKNHVEKCGLKSAWEKVMCELNLILDWDNVQKADWRKKIKAMSGDVQSDDVDERFIKRAPLQTIFEVVKC